MITYEQAKTLVEGQVVYTIKEKKVKEARITALTAFEASHKPPYSKANCRICYKLKSGVQEYIAWALENYPVVNLYLTREEAADALLSDLYIRRQELEDQLTRLEIRINEAKKFGGLNLKE